MTIPTLAGDRAGYVQRRIFGASRQAGHRKEQTTAKIYQRNTLEAHRRNAAMRQNFRAGNKE